MSFLQVTSGKNYENKSVLNKRKFAKFERKTTGFDAVHKYSKFYDFQDLCLKNSTAKIDDFSLKTLKYFNTKG